MKPDGARMTLASIQRSIATLGGIGLLPKAPGTWGSLATVLVLWPVAIQFAANGLWIAILGGSVLSIWTTKAAVDRWGEDPPQMVIDEWAGQAIPLLGLPLTGSAQPDLLWLLGAFALFRLFDITKPFGADEAQQLPSGFGILADDLLAGFYAWICLQGILWLL
ncbi:MAG: phosphatidylglycerophosphatase A [Balneolaceae bacterium]